MSKLNFTKGKFSKFISSKGFYVAIAACLIGAGAATWFAVDRTITGIEDNNNQMIESENQWNDYPQLEDVGKKQTGEQKPKGSKASTSSSSASDSSSASSSPERSRPASGQSAASAAAQEDSGDTAQPGVQVSLPNLAYAPPVNGDILTPFSNGELVKNVTLNDWRTHDGLDLTAAKGTEITAAADGEVTEIASDPLWGTVVTIVHPDGNQTIYSGLAKETTVNVGDAVLTRQVIGKLEGVPCEINQDSHLHFSIRQEGKFVDPLAVLQKEITGAD